MTSPGALTISLPPDIDDFVRARVSSGQYADSTAVVLEGLRLLQDHEQTRGARLAAVTAQLGRGVDEADRGEFVSADAIFDQAIALIESRRAAVAARQR